MIASCARVEFTISPKLGLLGGPMSRYADQADIWLICAMKEPNPQVIIWKQLDRIFKRQLSRHPSPHPLHANLSLRPWASVSFFHNAPSGLSQCADTIASHRAFLRVQQNSANQVPTDLPARAPLVSVDQVVSDFDGVTFHLSTPESKSKILISIAVKCFNELVSYGAQQVLEREYGPYIVPPVIGYDFSVVIDLENVPDDPGRTNTRLMYCPWLTSFICRVTGGSNPSTVVNEAQCDGSPLWACIWRFRRPTGAGVEIYKGVSTGRCSRGRRSDVHSLPGRRSHIHQSQSWSGYRYI